MSKIDEIFFQNFKRTLINLFRPYYSEMNDGVRRKNATRESTNTLKAWLNEHKKNPYPTKGEKIMLAIITKMTLTQVRLIRQKALDKLF